MGFSAAPVVPNHRAACPLSDGGLYLRPRCLQAAPSPKSGGGVPIHEVAPFPCRLPPSAPMGSLCDVQDSLGVPPWACEQDAMKSGCHVLPNVRCLHPLCSLTPCGPRSLAAGMPGALSQSSPEGGAAHLVSSVHWHHRGSMPFPLLPHPVTWTPNKAAFSESYRSPYETPLGFF